MEYQTYNDNELVLLAKEHNEEANTILYNKYKPLITKKCSGIFKYVKNKGIEFSDLMQECLIGFEESIRNYNLDDKVTFYTFTNICMTRQLGTLVRKLNRDKHRPLNEAIPLENTIEEENNLLDFIGDNSQNPELGLLDEVEFQELYDKIINILTNFEECVFNLKLQDFEYREIALILDKDVKSIDNAIQRIKSKIRSLNIVNN